MNNKTKVVDNFPISIITPLYNTDEVIFETVESIRRQTFNDFNWIIVNDGSSSEKALKVIESLPSLDTRIRIVSHDTNKGLPAARNTGIRESSTPYLFFLDADDLIDSTFIEKAFLFLQSNRGHDFVNSYVVGFGAQDYKWTGGFHEEELFLRENRNTSCFMARRDVFEQVLFDEMMLDGCEDWDFWLNAASKGFWGYTIPEYLFFYRRSAGNRWATLEGKASLEQIQKQLYIKYAPQLSKGFPQKKLNSYEFGYIVPAIPTTTLSPSNRNMHIMCILPWLKIGGADQFNLNLLKGLKCKGWSITVITTLGSEHPWEEQFKEFSVDIFHLGNLGEDTSFSSFIEYLINSRQPRLLFLSNSMYGYYALPFIKQRFPSLPIVDYLHCEDPGWYGGGYPYFSTLFSGFIDFTYTTSINLKNWCVQKGGNADKIEVKYINVDTKAIIRDVETKKRLRAQLGLGKDIPLILYVARLTEQKQPYVLVQTLDALNKKNLQFKCVIIGDGPDQPHLLEALHSKQLLGCVQYLGSQPNNVVLQYMDAADIFFLPSKYEGIALSIYEAMAKELAVVGANVGGQSELLTKDCGHLIGADNIERSINEYTNVLEQLIEDPSEIRKLGKKARERVVQHFDLDAMIEDMHVSFMRLTAVETLDVEDTKQAYLLVLNRMIHLENENASLSNITTSRAFTIIDKYKKPYNRLKSAYHKYKRAVKFS